MIAVGEFKSGNPSSTLTFHLEVAYLPPSGIVRCNRHILNLYTPLYYGIHIKGKLLLLALLEVILIRGLALVILCDMEVFDRIGHSQTRKKGFMFFCYAG